MEKLGTSYEQLADESAALSEASLSKAMTSFGQLKITGASGDTAVLSFELAGSAGICLWVLRHLKDLIKYGSKMGWQVSWEWGGQDRRSRSVVSSSKPSRTK